MSACLLALAPKSSDKIEPIHLNEQESGFFDTTVEEVECLKTESVKEEGLPCAKEEGLPCAKEEGLPCAKEEGLLCVKEEVVSCTETEDGLLCAKEEVVTCEEVEACQDNEVCQEEECCEEKELCQEEEECCVKPVSKWALLWAAVLWFVIFSVIFWLLLYSLKPYFVLNPETNQVDAALVLGYAVLFALILLFIIWIIKLAISYFSNKIYC